MTGRPRRDRAGARQPQASSSPPARHDAAHRTVEIDPQLEPASLMPPPSSRGRRTLRSQSHEVEPPAEIARRGTRRDLRERSVRGVSSNLTKVTGTDAFIDYVEPHSEPFLLPSRFIPSDYARERGL